MGFLNFIKGLFSGKKESVVKEEKLDVLNEVVSSEVTEMTERLKDVSSKPLEKVEASTSVKEIKSKSRTKKAVESKEKAEQPKEKKSSKKPEKVEKPKAEKTKKKADKKS